MKREENNNSSRDNFNLDNTHQTGLMPSHKQGKEHGGTKGAWKHRLISRHSKREGPARTRPSTYKMFKNNKSKILFSKCALCAICDLGFNPSTN